MTRARKEPKSALAGYVICWADGLREGAVDATILGAFRHSSFLCAGTRAAALLALKTVNLQHTPAEPKPDLPLEIAHLLLIDVAGYSKLLVNEQIEILQELKRIVRGTDCFRVAEANDKRNRLTHGNRTKLPFFQIP